MLKYTEHIHLSPAVTQFHTFTLGAAQYNSSPSLVVTEMLH